jgi:DNA-binding CsgD family transcriptional regulator
MAEPQDATKLEAVADEEWTIGNLDACITARELAYAEFDASGDARGSARSALALYDSYAFKGRHAVANGWLQRAKRSLEGQPDVPERAVLLEREAEVANGSGALELALEKAGKALEIGRRLRNADIEAEALQCRARIVITLGRTAEGFGLFDEAMLLAAEGRLGTFVLGKVYCSLISVCDQLGELQRAAEWTEVGSKWSRDQASPFFPGLCRVHRAELLRLRGDWVGAEAEARKACAELTNLHVTNAGAAFYEIGEIRRRMGDLDGAEGEFRRADELGFEPQPGLALLRLAQGKIDAASRSITTALAEATWDRLVRAKLLPARAEIAVAAGAIEDARAATAELKIIADEYPTPWLVAVTTQARGRVELAAGDGDAACGSLRRALEQMQALELPYEVADTRLLLGTAYRAVGDDEAAAVSFDAGVQLLARLGADTTTARGRARRAGTVPLPNGLTAREAEVLRLLASGRTNKQLAAELGLSEKTVERHLSNIFAKIGVSTRAAATAFAFEHRIVAGTS